MASTINAPILEGEGGAGEGALTAAEQEALMPRRDVAAVTARNLALARRCGYDI